MVKYAEWCRWALARAHAKSGDATMISGYFGNSSKFDKAIASFAVTYTDQNERDYQAFLKAIRAGKIEVYNE
jgi:predicted alpha/beta hydrolase